MRLISLLFIPLLIWSCQSEQPKTTSDYAPEDAYYVPNIEIPGLGVDHHRVATVLYQQGVNYNLVYTVEDRREIRDKISRLSDINYDLATELDTMVAFSIHALRSTLYSRLAKDYSEYQKNVEEDLLKAISLIDGKEKFRKDIAFEKLALGSNYFLMNEIEKAEEIMKELIENFQDVSIQGEPMYISRSSLITYFQMMSALSAQENSERYVMWGADYLESISADNDNELGIQADNMLFRFYNFMGNPDRAAEIGRRLEMRANS